MAVAGRKPKQKRSQETRAKITAAAIQLLATKGIAGINHRLVAKAAGVSLSSTTYYFDKKSDIVAIASNEILKGYADTFATVVKRYTSGAKGTRNISDLITQIVHNAAGKHSSGTLAWAEITLDAARNEDSLALSKKWHDQLVELWVEIADTLGSPRSAETARASIDLTVGLLYLTRALGLSAEQVDRVIAHKANPLEEWAVPAQPTTLLKRDTPKKQLRKKSDQTRDQILNAAIELLKGEGTASLSHRKIAQLVGLTPAAPSYHFKSIVLLLRAAQEKLFEDSKERLQTVITDVDLATLDADQLIDVTTSILHREATENAANNLASFAIWLEAARVKELRPMVWSSVAEQIQGWNRLLQAVKPTSKPIDGLLFHATYTGILIRLISTGSRNSDLALVRKELVHSLNTLLKDVPT